MPTPLARHRAAEPDSTGNGRSTAFDLVRRYVAVALLVLLVALLVEVLFESWVQELFGTHTVDADGKSVLSLPDWPKQLKNGLLVALVALSAVKITLERRWREFWTRADIALVVLVVIMILAGVFGTSGPKLIGEAIFVYLRGAIVFYAVRALHPTWAQIKRVLWIVGAVIGLNVVIAVIQMFTRSAIGPADHTWADLSRATGLLDHPNHLGHILGVVLIGLFAWMTGLEKVTRWWWVTFGVAALGMAATQSRESMLAAVVAGVLIWLLRRGRARTATATSESARPAAGSPGKTVLIGASVIIALFAINTLARPGNLEQLWYRVQGVSNAVQTQAGQENCPPDETITQCVNEGKAPAREVRLLFIQQGARLLVHRPVLGFGVGQFGGIVAEENDPNWEKDPRFGPGGFNLYEFDGTTVDCFWLHEGMETGVLGLLAYLAWLWLITVPLLGVTRRFAGRRVWGAGGRREEGAGRVQNAALWGIGAMVFSVIVAVFSPALEDPLYPPIVFAVFGLAWVLTRDVRHGGQPRTRDRQPDAIGS